ncbi:S-layer homology domain-containing protein [Veillonella sp.]
MSQNHWAYEQLSILKANGVIAGYPDGKYEGSVR